MREKNNKGEGEEAVLELPFELGIGFPLEGQLGLGLRLDQGQGFGLLLGQFVQKKAVVWVGF
eukprot:504569-Amorphochlora_amoeboformis.AAC.1